MLKHAFNATLPPDPRPGVIQPADWNAEHVFAGGTAGQLLQRDINDPSGASWTAAPTLSSLGPPQNINGGVLNLVPVQNMSGDLARKNIALRWNSVDATTSAHKQFCMNASGYANLSAEDNEVFEMGWNISIGGGLLNAAKSGARDAWESYYEPSVSGTGYFERHFTCVPLDFATKGEIRMMSISGFANQNRDNVHPTISFQGDFFSFTHPSTAGIAYGDSFRITIDPTNFGTNFALNNGFSYFTKGGIAKRGYPFMFQQNAAANANLSVLSFGTTFAGGFGTDALDDELHILIPPFPTCPIVHVGLGGQQSRFIVDGRNAADSHALLLIREEQGAGNKDAFIAVDGTSLLIGGPQTRLTDYLDATIAAGAHLTLTAALATFKGGIKHGSATLLQTSVALTNGAAAATATLTNAPAAGNPTKWIPINDNGTTRYIPAW